MLKVKVSWKKVSSSGTTCHLAHSSFRWLPFSVPSKSNQNQWKEKNAIRTVDIRTAVALFSHRCRIALLAFAHLTFALLSHSHCWPLRTVGIRTVGFAMVSFALLSFALLSYKHTLLAIDRTEPKKKIRFAKQKIRFDFFGSTPTRPGRNLTRTFPKTEPKFGLQNLPNHGDVTFSHLVKVEVVPSVLD